MSERHICEFCFQEHTPCCLGCGCRRGSAEPVAPLPSGWPDSRCMECGGGWDASGKYIPFDTNCCRDNQHGRLNPPALARAPRGDPPRPPDVTALAEEYIASRVLWQSNKMNHPVAVRAFAAWARGQLEVEARGGASSSGSAPPAHTVDLDALDRAFIVYWKDCGTARHNLTAAVQEYLRAVGERVLQGDPVTREPVSQDPRTQAQVVAIKVLQKAESELAAGDAETQRQEWERKAWKAGAAAQFALSKKAIDRLEAQVAHLMPAPDAPPKLQGAAVRILEAVGDYYDDEPDEHRVGCNQCCDTSLIVGDLRYLRAALRGTAKVETP